MKIPPYPIHRFAKPGVVYYSPESHCLVAGNDIAVVRIDVDDEDEPDKNRKAGTVPTDILAAACSSAAGSACELRLTGRVARLDVTDQHGDNVMTLEVPTERQLFDDDAAKRLVAVLAPGARDPRSAEVTLNPHVLALMAAAMGSKDRVTLVLTPDAGDREVRRPIRVYVESEAVGLLAPITTSGSEDKTGTLFGDAAQEMADDATDAMPDGVTVAVNGRRGRKRKGAES